MLQNLLPAMRKKEIRIEYYIRLSIVLLVFVNVVVLIGVVALFPSYMYVKSETEAVKEEYERYQAEVSANKELVEELVRHSYITTTLQEVLDEERFTDILNEVLLKRPEGVTVVGFSYSRTAHTMTLHGIAATRDLVAPFAQDLEESERFSSVPVPIADLAKNTDLPFQLQMTMSGYE